jgi:hypothetical protein
MNMIAGSVHADIIHRLQCGESVRAIARALGVNKSAVSARRQMLLYQGQELPPARGGHVGPASPRMLAWAKGIGHKRGSARVTPPSHCSKCGRPFGAKGLT